MVHCFCLCIVYVTLELNKPIHDLIYVPNGLNIYSLRLKNLSLQFSLADGASISLKQSHYVPARQHLLLLKVHSPSTNSHTSLPRPELHSFNLTSLCSSGRSSRAGCQLSAIYLKCTTEKSIASTNLLLFLINDCIPET